MINQTLKNRYKVTAELGRGAMGLVYRATDRQTRQEVAVKVIAANLALDADLLARFRREGEALRQLRHRNIVAFVEMFEHQGQQVIVMEYVPGGNLAGLIRRGPLPAAEVVRITLELCDALAQAHRINIIHRDIKPDNVLLAVDGTPKLTDFGVARLANRTTQLTGTGTQIGTPYYMSPEAWDGRTLDAQADIWSLGVVLYEMLTGQVPFGGDTLSAVMNKVLTAPLPDLNALRPDAPSALAAIIQKMLTRDKAGRYETMRQVAVDLEKVEIEARRAKEAAQRQAEEEQKARTLQAQEEARRKQEEEARWAQELRRKAEEAQKNQALQAQGQSDRAQEAARRRVEEEQKARARQAQEEARRAEEEARLEQQYATRLPEDYVPTEGVNSYSYGTLSDLWAKKPRSWRTLALMGGGALILVCLVLAGSLGLWALFGKPAPTAAPGAQANAAQTALAFVDQATQTAQTGASQTALAMAAAPSHTPAFTATPALGIGSTQVSPVDGMVQVYVPAGGFLMGSTDSDSQANSDEKPQHTVNLDAFWIDQTDVTNAMYAKCVASGKCQAASCHTESKYDQHPVVCVDWSEATAYCEWAGRRLPTEAEWEKAARGTDGRLYPWGNQAPSQTLANFNQNVGHTTEVGKYPAGASPYGALDMAGNVWQWVNDWYDANYYGTSPASNPPGPATGSFRVLRGGGWGGSAGNLRAAGRDNDNPAGQGDGVGFRCGAPPGK